MKYKNIILVLCMFMLVLAPMVSAKDFVIRNESDSTNNYFVVNGTTGFTGIGTGVPGAALDIKSSGNVDQSFFVAQDNDGNDQFAIKSGGAGDAWAGIYDTSGIRKILMMANGDSWFNGGNVGIGTTTPQRLLHVTGDILSNATINATGDICIEGGTCLSEASTSTGTVGGTGVANRAAFWTGSDTLNYDGNFTWDNVNKRLGIGTTAPSALLDLAPGSGITGLRILSTTAGDDAIRMDSDGEIIVDASGVEGGRFVVKNGGNVGIGTSSPQFKLDIAGTLGVVDGTTGVIQLGNGSSNQNAQLSYSGSGDNSLSISTNYAGGTGNYIGFSPGGTERVRFQQNGNVGIGTTTPQSKLNINGTLGSIAGGLSFGDGDTGFYENSDDDFFVSIGGSGRWKFSSTFMGSSNTGQGAFARENPSATNPNVVPSQNDPNTGIGWADADQLSLIAGGNEVLRLNSGNLTSNENLFVTGTVNATGDVCSGDTCLSDVGAGSMNASDSDTLDTYDSSFFMPLNMSVVGDFDFNGGWQSNGLSIVGGDIYAQTGWFYQINSLQVTNLDVNGSLIPDLNNQFNLGNSSMRWKDLYLGGNAYINGTTFGSFSGDGSLLTDIPTSAVVNFPTHLTNFTNDLGIGNWTLDKVNYFTQTESNATYILQSDEGNLSVNSSDYWDGLDTPADISGSQISNDLNWLNSTTLPSLNSTGWNRSGTNVFLANTNDNVGIGTSSPDELLELQSAISPMIKFDNTGWRWNIGAGTNTNNIPTSYFGIEDISGGSTPFVIAYTTGNIGIGTDSPSSKLELKGAGAQSLVTSGIGSIFINSNSVSAGDNNYGTGISFNGLAGGTTQRAGITPVQTGLDADVVGMAFLTHSSAIGADNLIEAMRIQAGGNIGIGTSSPGALLHVNGTGEMIIAGDTNEDGWISLMGRGMVGYDASGYTTLQGISGKGVRFNVNDDTFGSGTAMTILSDGNVGIGTAAPDEKLEVKGYIQATVDTGGVAGYKWEDGTTERWRMYKETNNHLYLYNPISGKFPLHFNTNGNVLIAEDGGNVGIGTTTPQNELNVIGDINATGLIYGNGSQLTGIDTTEDDPYWSANYSLYNSSWTTTDAEIWNVAGNGTLMFASDWNATNNSYVPYIGSSANVVLGDYNFSVGTSDLFVNSNTGNVGIGTSSPGYKLEVNVDGSGGILINTTNYPSIDMIADSDTNDYRFKLTQSPTGLLQFRTGQGATGVDGTSDSKMVIDATNGNVGIGTDIPSYSLHVVGTGYFTSDVSTGGWNYASKYYPFSASDDMYFETGEGKDIYFKPNGTEAMRIDSSGNVGIGTGTPNNKLEIESTDGTSMLGIDNKYTGTVSPIKYDFKIGATGSEVNSYYTYGNLDNNVGSPVTGWVTNYVVENSGGASAPNEFKGWQWMVWDGSDYVSRLNVEAGGKVGVGTTTPQNELNVIGDGNFTGNLYSNGALISSGSLNSTGWNRSGTNVFLANTGDNVGIGTGSPSSLLTLEADGPVLGFEDNAGGNNNDFSIKANAGVFSFRNADNDNDILALEGVTSEAMRIDSSGKVGIGTTTPQNELNVIGTVNATSFVGDGSGLTGIVGGRWNVSGTDLYPENLNYNVGIGTNNPGAELHIDTISGPGTLKISGSSSGYTQAEIILEADDAISRGAGIYTNNLVAGKTWYFGNPYSSYDDGFVINRRDSNYSSDTADYEDADVDNLFFVGNNGEVGINDYSPDYKLELNGTSGNGYFGITSLTGTDGDIFEIDSSGKVGIGTDSPDELLEVFNGNIKIGDDANVGRSLIFERNGNTLGRIGQVNNQFYFISPDSGDIRFADETNAGTNTPFMTIEGTSGNVGIGTTSPQNELNVIGDINATGLLYGNGSQLTGIDTTEYDPFWTANYSLYNDSWTTTDAEIWNVAGNGTLMFASDWNATNNSYVPYIGSSANVVLGDYNFSVGTSDLFVNSNTGNVGIGTASPDELLHVSGGNILVDNTYGLLAKRADGISTNLISVDSGDDVYIGSVNLDNIFLGVGTDSQTLTILQNGNVGIGTANPIQKLQINASTNDDGILLTASDGSPIFKVFQELGDDGRLQVLQDGSAVIQFNARNGQPSYFNAGNVGIGTTTPQNELNIVGDGNFTGTVYRNNKALIDWSEAINGTLLQAADITEKVSWTDLWSQVYNETEVNAINTSMKNYVDYVNGTMKSYVDISFAGIEWDYNQTTAAVNIINGTGLVRDWNSTGLIINWSSLAIEEDPLWSGNSTLVPYLASENTFTANNIFNGNLTVDGTDFFVNSNTGNVGIGTSSPQNVLNIIGDGNFTGSLYVNLGDIYTRKIYDSDDNNYYLDPSDTSKSLLVAGKVGIGTITPNNLLNLLGAGAGNADINLTQSTAGQAARLILDSDRDWRIASDGSLANDPLTFYDATATATRMIIDSSGRVGIGTTDMDGILHVTEADLADTPVFERKADLTDIVNTVLNVRTTDTGGMADGFGGIIKFQIKDNADTDNDIAAIGAVRDGADNSGSLVFRTENSGSSSEWMRIKPTGFVGIGTTTPSHKLNVIGDLNVTGTIYGQNISMSEAPTVESSPTNDLEASGMITTMQVDVNAFGFGACLKVDTDGNLIEADADSSGTMPCMAMALETGTGVKEILNQGYIRNDAWAWTPGAILYASTTAGNVTQTAPSGSGDQVQVIGIATNADRIYFNPDFTLVGVA